MEHTCHSFIDEKKMKLWTENKLLKSKYDTSLLETKTYRVGVKNISVNAYVLTT